MARARELRPQTRTYIDGLRDNLTELERGLATPRGAGQKAVELLRRLDVVYIDIAQLQQEQDINLRSEQTRLEYIEERLRGDRAADMVREVARTVGWDEIRSSVIPEHTQWWWYLDQYLAQRRRSQLRRLLVRGGITVLVLALLIGAYKQFLAPSPETAQKLVLMQHAEQYIEAGDLLQAIANYEEAASVDPGDPEIQLWLGVLYSQTGQQEASITAFRSARQSSSMFDYFLLRSRIYLQLQLLDEAASDIMAALGIDPHSNQALFILADVLERQGNYWEAVDLFQKVSSEASDPTLQVLAKVRYGMLLQAGPRTAAETPSPTVE